ncbi:MAG: 3-deoxy-D-manno-octulosonic acid kinase [Pseudomonadota bacterium]
MSDRLLPGYAWTVCRCDASVWWHRSEGPVLGVESFTPGGWSSSVPADGGRGNAWFVQDVQQRCVLRRYLRGGLVARLSRDRYVYSGMSRTRPFRELSLLHELERIGLPVPPPVGALVDRVGMFYRAALLTAAIDDATSVGARLRRGTLCAEDMQRAGRCIRRFHTAGVWHADLNADNILLTDDSVYLIDFDRGERRAGTHWQQGNLDRLARSLDKLSILKSSYRLDATLWLALMDGYRSVQS